jgi:FO synthase
MSSHEATREDPIQRPLSTSEVTDILGRAAEGGGLPAADATWLAERADLTSLLRAAATLRDRAKGRNIGYSKKVFIPLTHLCRDYCGYCTFRSDPKPGEQLYMAPEQVLEIAEAGRRAGCKEALFSLGDQPESIFPVARDFLRRQGFERTLQYLQAMSVLVLEETGLLPHANPGLMGAEDLREMKESNVSMGIMLESTSYRLLRNGGAHWKAPDKVPSLRLRTLEEAGRLQIAFTTGILIGIGETWAERIDSLCAIDNLHRRYGHIQEIIVQPFRPKADTRMAGTPEASLEDLKRTLAVARLIFDGEMNIQSPPNLLSRDYPQLLETGMNDWGGISPVTKDFINPEAAWPQIPSLAKRTAEAGFVLRERLAIYPEFAERPGFVSEPVNAYLSNLLGADGYAREEQNAC